MEKTRLTTTSLSELSQTDLADERMQYSALRLDLHFQIYLILSVDAFTALLKLLLLLLLFWFLYFTTTEV